LIYICIYTINFVSQLGLFKWLAQGLKNPGRPCTTTPASSTSPSTTSFVYIPGRFPQLPLRCSSGGATQWWRQLALLIHCGCSQMKLYNNRQTPIFQRNYTIDGETGSVEGASGEASTSNLTVSSRREREMGANAVVRVVNLQLDLDSLPRV
jgi:hypothetical protein